MLNRPFQDLHPSLNLRQCHKTNTAELTISLSLNNNSLHPTSGVWGFLPKSPHLATLRPGHLRISNSRAVKPHPSAVPIPPRFQLQMDCGPGHLPVTLGASASESNDHRPRRERT